MLPVRTLLASITMAAALLGYALPSQAQGLPAGAPSSLLDAEASNFEVLQHSMVGFWRGMSRSEFDARVQKDQDGKLLVRLGEFTFEANAVTFDEQGYLTGASVEFRHDDPKVIEDAFNAYKHALGAIPADYERSTSGTELVPDLQFAILGWRAPDGAESALARVHSYAAKAKSAEVKAAGVVSFAVRRH